MSFRRRGFSLIELAVVLAIMGILAAIGIPSYQDYVMRANRTIAKTVLAEIAVNQESWRTDRKQYATNLQSLGYPGVAGAAVWLLRDRNTVASTDTSHAGDAVYSLSLTGATATAFTVQAVPLNRQATKDTQCGTFRYDNLGTRTATGTQGNACWR
jgi:type IV pilus assembly protein PilE